MEQKTMMTVVRSTYAIVVLILIVSLGAFFAIIGSIALWGAVPMAAGVSVGCLWVVLVIRAIQVRLVLTPDRVRVTNFFRSVDVPRSIIRSVESGYFPFSAEPVLILVLSDRRIRVTSSMAATPIARARLVESLSGKDRLLVGGGPLDYSSDAALRILLAHPRLVILVSVALGLLLGRFWSLDWIWSAAAAVITGLVVGVGMRGVSKAVSKAE